MKKKKHKIKLFQNINKTLFLLTLFYAIMGAFLILDASSISSTLTYGNSSTYFYFHKQLIFIVLGYLGTLLILIIPTKYYKAISILSISVLLVVIIGIFINGQFVDTAVNEVKITILGMTFQPAEFIKVFIIMYMGTFYGTWANKKHTKYSFLIPIFVAVLPILFVLLGGDFGSAVIMAVLCALIFLKVPSEDKIVKTLKIIAIVFMVIGLLVLLYSYKIIPKSILEKDYRLNRFIYKNPCDRYEQDSGYQVCNGFIAINNGNLFGVGIGESIQKYLYLPASHTDFIFPIIVEEFGALIATLIILGYMIITYHIFKIATSTYRLQNSLICYGIGVYFLLHIFVNLGGVLAIIPLTGVPLPFLSYGGSFCITMICAFAIVQRINIENIEEKRRREIKKIVN
ncbi:MAG: FtsW/RodA/SpoVE family cell cycle protein [Tenericutes bacterium]|nr:FtsW/RodA/SpoVE family cell cycle protein [Mycoplasmatota bacterium]